MAAGLGQEAPTTYPATPSATSAKATGHLDQPGSINLHGWRSPRPERTWGTARTRRKDTAEASKCAPDVLKLEIQWVYGFLVA